MRVVVKRIGGCHRGLRFELDLPDAAPGNPHDESAALDGASRGAPGLAELTSLIAKKTEIPEWAQRVFYQGRYLHGQGSLAEKGVPAEGAVLLLATSAHYREPTAAVRAEPGAAMPPATSSLAASSSAAATSAAGTGATPAGSSERMQEVPSPQRAPASLSPTPAAPSTGGGDPATQTATGNVSSSRVAASASSATANSPNVANAEDLSKLSVAELKQRLRDRGVSFEGCAEKSDLLDLLRNAPQRPAAPLPNRPSAPAPKRPPQPLPEMLGGAPFGAGPPPGFMSVGMGPFATGGMLNTGTTNAANLGVFLQQLGPAMDSAMSQAFAEVPMQPARGDMGPAPEPPQHSPDGEANPQPTPMGQPTAARPQAAHPQAAHPQATHPQGQEAPGQQPTITMSFPAGAPPTQAINAMMQQLGPQLQQMLGPFAQLFGEQNGGMPHPGGESQGPAPAPQGPAPR